MGGSLNLEWKSLNVYTLRHPTCYPRRIFRALSEMKPSGSAPDPIPSASPTTSPEILSSVSYCISIFLSTWLFSKVHKYCYFSPLKMMSGLFATSATPASLFSPPQAAPRRVVYVCPLSMCFSFGFLLNQTQSDLCPHPPPKPSLADQQ